MGLYWYDHQVEIEDIISLLGDCLTLWRISGGGQSHDEVCVTDFLNSYNCGL